MKRKPARAIVVGCVAGSLALTALAVPALASPGTAPGTNGDPEIGADGWVHVEPNGTVLGPDPYYPKDGNGGYRAENYKVDVKYDPASKKLDGTAVMTAKTTQRLKQFNLDLQGLEVSSVKVNGAEAKHSRADEHELVIVPATVLEKDAAVTVEVVYSGTPAAIDTPRGKTGWQELPGGGAVAAGAPHSARTWFPINDTQMAKATFDLTATVPDGWSVVSIGAEQQVTRANGQATFTWKEAGKVPPQGIAIGIDKWEFERGSLPDGKPVVNAFAPDAGDKRDLAKKLPEVVEFLATKMGAYPQSSAGGMFLPKSTGYTAPAQGRPVYDGSADLSTLVYATASQWWGNLLSVEMWKDTCLMDCVAHYATWMWDEKNGADLAARYKEIVEANRDKPEFWATNLGDPGAGKEYATTAKGVLLMHALRKQIGDAKFDSILKSFPANNKNWNQGWHDWELYVNAVTQQKLNDFFAAWVHGTKIPEEKFLYPQGAK
ncbi:peptidase M1-like protein [Herbihabitans rhizosphaerae]|uniref:Peptidase M1-like protein n=1 Tax=Herbihabitans rhizosphaerae TaxID=1872711 RepID=A0A4V2ESZ0_9PSEU|nr:peptidase M1 [Herbihabitans rhizosphaerae]RZS39243.1 peptidase M1-like protein [Herbihabitans rhizosphaerae]